MNELRIDKKIYKEINLKQAIKAFSNISKVTYVEQSECWLLTFQKSAYNIEITAYEFENFLISLEATDGVNHGSM